MVRTAEGWKLRQDRRTGIWYVRFRWQKVRYEISTGERDYGAAGAKAAELYAAVISGRWSRQVLLARPGRPLQELVAEWIVDVEPECKPKTRALYELHFRAHLIPFFRTLERVTPASAADYRRARLKHALRETVVKELTTLRRFLRWCREHGYIAELPRIENPPPGALGKNDTRTTKAGAQVRHKRKSVPLSESEARAILERLPERSSRARRGKHRHAVKDYFVVLWETGLRPTTVDDIAAPTHFRKGDKELRITLEVDKVRYQRDLPLTPAARAALERNAPDAGPIFGRHDFRIPWRAACRAAAAAGKLEAWKADKVTPYDFRHGRTTDLLSRPGATLPGVSYLVGHKQITTTNRYVQAPKSAAEAVLRRKGGGRP